MSVPTDAVSELVFAGAGSAAPLGVTFKFIDAADLVVTRIVSGTENPTPLVRGVDYTVTGGNGSTGSVIPAAAIPVGTSWRVRRETPNGQPAVLESGKYQPEQIEGALDRQALINQEQDRELARAVKVGRGEAEYVLPSLAARANTVLGWDGSGNFTEYPLSSFATAVAFATARSEFFTATAGQTAFTLQRAPGTINNCQVFIDGVRQYPGVDFTLSGTTLTLLSGLHLGARVLVTYAEAMALGIAAAQDVMLDSGRSVEAKLGEMVSIFDYPTFAAANADARRKFVPAGTHASGLAVTELRGPYYGDGQVTDTAGNKRAHNFSHISAAPASVGNWDTPTTAFNGDLSKVQRVSEHWITGALTLGQPASPGYFLARETAAELLYGFVAAEAGFNRELDINQGRTGAAIWQRQVFHAGGGDAYCHWVTGIATGTRASSTHWLANPAIALYSGQALGGANGVYLQGVGDVNFDDLGFDVAAQGLTFNFYRQNKTGAKQADWTALRLQSQGTFGVNAWIALVGQADIGIDAVRTNFGTNKAFVTVSAGTRYYGNATNTDPISLSRNTAVGDAWFAYDASLSGWVFVALNTASFIAGGTQFTLLPRLNLQTAATFADNAAAIAGGYNPGDVYRTADGTLKVCYA